jgi:hypothetical protein
LVIIISGWAVVPIAEKKKEGGGGEGGKEEETKKGRGAGRMVGAWNSLVPSS